MWHAAVIEIYPYPITFKTLTQSSVQTCRIFWSVYLNPVRALPRATCFYQCPDTAFSCSSHLQHEDDVVQNTRLIKVTTSSYVYKFHQLPFQSCLRVVIVAGCCCRRPNDSRQALLKEQYGEDSAFINTVVGKSYFHLLSVLRCYLY